LAEKQKKNQMQIKEKLEHEKQQIEQEMQRSKQQMRDFKLNKLLVVLNSLAVRHQRRNRFAAFSSLQSYSL